LAGSSSSRLRVACNVLGALVALVSLIGVESAAARAAPSWLEIEPLTGPCEGRCGTAIYFGTYVQDAMSKVLVGEPTFPTQWRYENDHLVATAVTRRIARLWGHVDVEPEVGIGQRYGKQDETEVWGAFFFRYRGFPWDDVVTTSFAVSTGFNYATDVSEVEQDRARDGEGSQIMHFFAPEITFALPRHPQYELLFRFHHRSGVFGLVSDAWGGAQYGSVGLRWRF
jgi:hypothetical protein